MKRTSKKKKVLSETGIVRANLTIVCVRNEPRSPSGENASPNSRRSQGLWRVRHPLIDSIETQTAPFDVVAVDREYDHYKWVQNNDEVTITVKIDDGRTSFVRLCLKAGPITDVKKQHIEWELEAKKIKLYIKGEKILDGATFRKVNTEDSLWSFGEIFGAD